MGLLDGKVALITGGAHGIGRATALRFASEGAQVVVNDIGSARDGSGVDESPAMLLADEIASLGGSAIAHHGDIATPEGASGAVSAAVERFGALDILVNNAGILRDKTLLKMSEAMWDSVVAVHLKGTFLCTQAAAQQMKAHGQGGRIINTTSVSGMLGNFGQANYSAAKAGIYGLTRTASIELQRYQIMVNAIAPLAKTRMTEDLPLFEKLDGSMTPEHVSPAHVFFASELSNQMTGLVLAVAGGKLSIYRLFETRGKFKEADNGVWTPEEIQENFEAISKG